MKDMSLPSKKKEYKIKNSFVNIELIKVYLFTLAFCVITLMIRTKFNVRISEIISSIEEMIIYFLELIAL